MLTAPATTMTTTTAVATATMAELMSKIDEKLYGKYVMTTKKGTKVLYAKTNKASSNMGTMWWRQTKPIIP